MKLHQRVPIVNRAERDLRRFLEQWATEHGDLTDGEFIGILTNVFASELGGYAKAMIRDERHGDPDHPGGLA